MSLRRAHVPVALLAGADVGVRLALPVPVQHRLFRVLRLGTGDRVELFDGAGTVVRGVLQEPDTVVVDERVTGADALPVLLVAQAMAKADKIELVVEKATELGAHAVWLVQAERSVVDWGEKAAARVERLGRIAADAARQSGRATVAAVDGVLKMGTLCERVRAVVAAGGVVGVGVVDAALPWSQLLTSRDWHAGGALFCVGPEGGFSPAEIAALVAAGAEGVRLGQHVMRTETAGIAALAVAQATLGIA